jgi:hypothetical protein
MAAAWRAGPRCTIPSSMAPEAIFPAGDRPRGGACSHPFAPTGKNAGPTLETTSDWGCHWDVMGTARMTGFHPELSSGAGTKRQM